MASKEVYLSEGTFGDLQVDLANSNVIHLPPGTFVNSNCWHQEHKDWLGNISTSGYTLDTFRFKVPTNDISKYSVEFVNTGGRENAMPVLNDIGDGVEPTDAYAVLKEKTADGKDKIISSVKFADTHSSYLRGGNKDFAGTIQIETPDGKIHPVANPKYNTAVLTLSEEAKFKNEVDRKIEGKPEIPADVLKAVQAVLNFDSGKALTADQMQALQDAAKSAKAGKKGMDGPQ